MSEDKVVTVGQLVTALENIQYWCGLIREALAKLDATQKITVSDEVHGGMVDNLSQNLGGCKPH